MKRLSLLKTIVTTLISLSFLTCSTIHATGGQITFKGYVYEPQCEVKLSSQTQVSVDCYRNGKNESITNSIKDGKKLNFRYVNVEYIKLSKIPILKVTHF